MIVGKRLVKCMTEKEKTSEIMFCPASEPYVRMEQFIQNGRKCNIDTLICFGWDDPEKQRTCPVRKYGRSYYLIVSR